MQPGPVYDLLTRVNPPSFYNGLYGEAPPGRGIFFRLQIHEREGVSLSEVHGK